MFITDHRVDQIIDQINANGGLHVGQNRVNGLAAVQGVSNEMNGVGGGSPTQSQKQYQRELPPPYGLHSPPDLVLRPQGRGGMDGSVLNGKQTYSARGGDGLFRTPLAPMLRSERLRSDNSNGFDAKVRRPQYYGESSMSQYWEHGNESKCQPYQANNTGAGKGVDVQAPLPQRDMLGTLPRETDLNDMGMTGMKCVFRHHNG